MNSPTSSISQFSFQPQKVRAGTVYHYIKSNIDGSYPARIYIRLMDEDQLDVWKFEAHNFDAAHVRAHMNWDTFSADQIESWVVTLEGNRRPQAKLVLSRAKNSFQIHWRDRVDMLAVGHTPVHVYNFDFISLNMSLRHWTKPEGQVTFGVVQPNFDPDPESLLKYEGMVTLRYVGDEERQHQPCRRYEISGEGLRNYTGMIWVDRQAEHIADMEIPIADNPSWDDFKFRLVSVAMLDEQSWDAFLENEIQKLDPAED